MIDHRGSRNGNSKLTEEKVLDIRAFASQDGVKHAVIAVYYDIDCSTVGKIVRGELWAHLEE